MLRVYRAVTARQIFDLPAVNQLRSQTALLWSGASRMGDLSACVNGLAEESVRSTLGAALCVKTAQWLVCIVKVLKENRESGGSYMWWAEK